MRPSLRALAFVSLAAGTGCAGGDSLAGPPSACLIPGQYVVRFEAGVESPAHATEVLARKHGVDVRWSLVGEPGGFVGRMDGRTAFELGQEPVVASVAMDDSACIAQRLRPVSG